VRRAFVTGDRVVVFDMDDKDTGLRGEVVAQNGDYLWLDCGSDEMRTALAYRCQPFVDERVGETFVGGLRVDPPKPQPQAKGIVPPPSMDVATYIVVEGDTLTGIANTFETSVDTIRIQNKIADPDLILAGQVLKITDNRIPF
jgi:LysM repeat protein